MEFFRDTHFDFMSQRKVAISASVLAILAGVISLVIKGGPAYNIDFLGGTEVQVQFQQPKETQALRKVLASINLAAAEIKQFGNPWDFVIRVGEEENVTQISGRIMTALKQAFPEDEPDLLAVNSVGPKIGKELRESAVWAVLVSLVLLLLYDFFFCLLFGIVVGTYSSIFIAAPIVVGWYKKHQAAKMKRQPVAVG